MEYTEATNAALGRSAQRDLGVGGGSPVNAKSYTAAVIPALPERDEQCVQSNYSGVYADLQYL